MPSGAWIGRSNGWTRSSAARLDRLSPTIQRELVAIARAVSAGRPARAAERAERLAGILEHPAASG